MSPQEIRETVRCSACHGELGATLNLVEMRYKAEWDYPTAGNLLTGEDGLAVAIVCDPCLESRHEIVEAVEFTKTGPLYHYLRELEKQGETP